MKTGERAGSTGGQSQRCGFTPYDPEETGELGTSYFNLNPEMDQELGFIFTEWVPDPTLHRTDMGGPKNSMSLKGNYKTTMARSTKLAMWFGFAPGTVHNSFSEKGCTVAVFSEKVEVPQNDSLVNRPNGFMNYW